MGVRVTSEIGRLKRVIVHRPGAELLAVTPHNRSEYLYDDIIDLAGARAEHTIFTAVLQQFAQVDDLYDLLHVTLQNPAALQFLITRSEEITANRSLGKEMRDLPTAVLLQRFIEGWRPWTGLLSETLRRPSYVLPPVPNLFFTRDAAMVLGDAVAIAAMRFSSRWPEEALMRTLFGYHPDFAGSPIVYDGSDERRHGYNIEGGDVHPLREDLLMVGLSERTSAATLDSLLDKLFAHSAIADVIVVVLPEPSPAIHLDMVWTQVDRDLCAVYPPTFFGPLRSPVLHQRRGEATLRQPSSVFAALQDVGMPMEPVLCGGRRTELQQREQWASGCNFLAVAPGHVLAYARNEETLRAMQAAGFTVVDSEAFLQRGAALPADQKTLITVPGSELVRGGGGPRCMTCPVHREDL
jgi:arginine deiminase